MGENLKGGNEGEQEGPKKMGKESSRIRAINKESKGVAWY